MADVLARDLWPNHGGPGLDRKLRAGCLVKSAWPTYWPGTVNQTRGPCPGSNRRLVRNMCAGRLLKVRGTSSLVRDFNETW